MYKPSQTHVKVVWSIWEYYGVIPVVSLGSLRRPAGLWPCSMLRNSLRALRQRDGMVCHTSWMMENTPRTPSPTTC